MTRLVDKAELHHVYRRSRCIYVGVADCGYGYVYTRTVRVAGVIKCHMTFPAPFCVRHCCETMSNRKERELLDTCRDGNLEKVRALVDSKQVDPRRVIDTREWGLKWTPLHYACM